MSTSSTAFWFFSRQAQDQNFSRRRPTSSATRFLLRAGGSIHLQLLLLRRRQRHQILSSISDSVWASRRLGSQSFLGLHCSSTAAAAYPKFLAAPCSSTKLLRPPAWLDASEYREAPGPLGGCVGFIGLAFPPSTTMMLEEESSVSRSCFLIHCVYPYTPVPATRGLSAAAR